MGQLQTAAWILAAADSGHQDRIYTVYTKEQGLLRLMGYGMRAQRPRVTGALQLFALVDLEYSEGRYGMGVIKGCSLLRACRPIREELPRMAYAMFLAEVMIGLCPSHAADRALFLWLEQVVQALEERHPRIAAVAAAWQMLDLLGYRPELEECILCRTAGGQPAHFCGAGGGMICCSCQPTSPTVTPLDEPVRRCITEFMALDWRKPTLSGVRGSVLHHVEKILLYFLESQLGHPLRSVSVIRDLVDG